MNDVEPVDYIFRQKSMDDEYRKAFENLTPEQRAAMEAGGVRGEADITGLLGLRSSRLGLDKDAAEAVENNITASVTPDMAALVDTSPDLLREEFDISAVLANRINDWHNGRVHREVERQRADLLFRTIGLLLKPGNILVRVHALAHAARMASAFSIASLRHSAAILGVTAEAIRKVTWKLGTELGFPPLEGAKSKEAKKKYKADKKINHWRNQKVCKGLLKNQKVSKGQLFKKAKSA